MYKYLEDGNTINFIRKLNDFVRKTMQERRNSVIGMAPVDVTNHRFLKVLNSSRNSKIKKVSKSKLKIGEKVRLGYDDFSFRSVTIQSLQMKFFSCENCNDNSCSIKQICRL